jgi:hypothetical protein
MKMYSGVDVYIHVFLNSALVAAEWSASSPDRFNRGERAPCTHWIGGWVDPGTGLDDVEKGNSWPYRDSKSDPSVVQPVANLYTLSRLLNNKVDLKIIIIFYEQWICFA